METITITIAKEERKQAWGEHIADAGFERDQFENRYRKRIVVWEKDGVEYTAATSTAENGDLVITLTEYSDTGKRSYK